MLPQSTIDTYVKVLKNKGENGLYRYTVGNGIMMSVKISNPEVEILNISEKFFSLYRRTGDDGFFIIGKILRRAAHTIYRQFLKLNKEKEINMRFLNVVQ